jgi:hypothetical protein
MIVQHLKRKFELSRLLSSRDDHAMPNRGGEAVEATEWHLKRMNLGFKDLFNLLYFCWCHMVELSSISQLAIAAVNSFLAVIFQPQL